jgi:hypothetical protein
METQALFHDYLAEIERFTDLAGRPCVTSGLGGIDWEKFDRPDLLDACVQRLRTVVRMLRFLQDEEVYESLSFVCDFIETELLDMADALLPLYHLTTHR